MKKYAPERRLQYSGPYPKEDLQRARDYLILKMTGCSNSIKLEKFKPKMGIPSEIYGPPVRFVPPKMPPLTRNKDSFTLKEQSKNKDSLIEGHANNVDNIENKQREDPELSELSSLDLDKLESNVMSDGDKSLSKGKRSLTKLKKQDRSSIVGQVTKRTVKDTEVSATANKKLAKRKLDDTLVNLSDDGDVAGSKERKMVVDKRNAENVNLNAEHSTACSTNIIANESISQIFPRNELTKDIGISPKKNAGAKHLDSVNETKFSNTVAGAILAKHYFCDSNLTETQQPIVESRTEPSTIASGKRRGHAVTADMNEIQLLPRDYLSDSKVRCSAEDPPLVCVKKEKIERDLVMSTKIPMCLGGSNQLQTHNSAADNFVVVIDDSDIETEAAPAAAISIPGELINLPGRIGDVSLVPANTNMSVPGQANNESVRNKNNIECDEIASTKSCSEISTDKIPAHAVLLSENAETCRSKDECTQSQMIEGEKGNGLKKQSKPSLVVKKTPPVKTADLTKSNICLAKSKSRRGNPKSGTAVINDKAVVKLLYIAPPKNSNFPLIVLKCDCCFFHSHQYHTMHCHMKSLYHGSATLCAKSEAGYKLESVLRISALKMFAFKKRQYIFLCPICKHPFLSAFECSLHHLYCHNEVCSKPGRHNYSVNEIVHRQFRPVSKAPMCFTCRRKFTSEQAGKRHTKAVNTHRSLTDIEKETQSLHPNALEVIRCCVCELLFGDRSEWFDHVNSKHNYIKAENNSEVLYVSPTMNLQWMPPIDTDLNMVDLKEELKILTDVKSTCRQNELENRCVLLKKLLVS